MSDTPKTESLTESLTESAALERVMGQVLEMKAAGDIDHLIREVWGVLEGLQYDFVSCAFLLIDHERDWMSSYNVWSQHDIDSMFGDDEALRHVQRLGEDAGGLPRLVIFTGQTSLEDAPSIYQEAIAAWRTGQVERHVLSPAEIEELARVNTRRYRAPMTAESYPVGSHLYVPFEHGVFTLRTDRQQVDPFSAAQVNFLTRLVRTISVGYARYREFLRLELDRTVQHMRAEVQAMKRGDDIIDLMGLLWDELHRVGIDFHYMSIAVSENEHDDVHLYGVWHQQAGHHLRGAAMFRYPIFRANVTTSADLYYNQVPRLVWDETHTEFSGVHHVSKEEVAAYAERTGRLWQTEGVAAADAASRTLQDFVMMAAHLPQGRIMVAQSQETADAPVANFTPEHIKILEAFAEALGMGFTRFFDFQRLERHNRELEVERSVDQLRAEVASMRQSSDIAGVTVLLGRQLRELGLEHWTCSFNVIDAEAGLVHLYAVGPSERIRSMPVATIEASQLDEIIERLGVIGAPMNVPDVIEGFDFAYVAEHLQGSPALEERDLPPRVVHRSEAEALEELPRYQRRWADSWTLEMLPRSVIRVPFSHGSIAVMHLEADQFAQPDVDLVAAFADAISLGFTRFHDFQRLEQRNRELEIERAVEQVQIGVQNMKTSGDIMPVITLLSHELKRLGLDYSWCTISIVDREAEKVRVYGTVGTVPLFAETFLNWTGKDDLPFGPDTIERLENEDGPLFITGIPGASTEFANYMVAPLDSFHGRLQQIEETTITSRNEEETEAAKQEYIRRWNRDSWPEELTLRSVLRTPFSGGTIALTDGRTDHFSAREARILERFAEAFTLGYTRHLDFRRLEAQNKALTAANRIKSEFLTNMSHELRTPMNAIINFSSMALDGVCGELTDELRDILGEIDQNGEHLMALINDVLDLSKIEAGAMQLNRAACDPADCVDTAVAALAHAAQDKGLKLTAVAPDDLPPLLADERRLTQHVLINLVKNAIKFTETGTVECGVRADGGDVLFWVSDTGIGIAPVELERIFETFHQVDTSITRQAEGSGLGLAIARKFVELHRGRIWVESEEAKGSIFYLTIPAVT